MAWLGSLRSSKRNNRHLELNELLPPLSIQWRALEPTDTLNAFEAESKTNRPSGCISAVEVNPCTVGSIPEDLHPLTDLIVGLQRHPCSIILDFLFCHLLDKRFEGYKA